MTDANGWDIGVNVDGGTQGPEDHFTVYATGGSNESSRSVRIATVEHVEGVRWITVYNGKGKAVARYTT